MTAFMYSGLMSDPDVRELGLSDARANLTDLVAEVRLLKQVVVLTRRGKPQALIVPLDFCEHATAVDGSA